LVEWVDVLNGIAVQGCGIVLLHAVRTASFGRLVLKRVELPALELRRQVILEAGCVRKCASRSDGEPDQRLSCADVQQVVIIPDLDFGRVGRRSPLALNNIGDRAGVSRVDANIGWAFLQSDGTVLSGCDPFPIFCSFDAELLVLPEFEFRGFHFWHSMAVGFG
jgi:hypothetical protein